MMNLVATSDLRVLGIEARVLRRHVAARIAQATVVVVVVLAEVTVITGRIPALLLLVSAVASAVAWSLLPIGRCSRAAQRRRRDMEMATAVLLDLVNVLLAGGAGVETALLTAASVGDGWSFDTIRASLSRAQQARKPHWQALDDLGRDLDVLALRNVAQSLRTASVNGGRIRQSLASRASALRKSNMARIEFEAERRTERMGVPMVLMFIGFVVFIGYPAMVTTVTTL